MLTLTNAKKSSSKEVDAKSFVSKKTKPSEVQEFKGGRMRRRAMFEDDEGMDAAPSSSNTVTNEEVEYDESSEESMDLHPLPANKVPPSSIVSLDETQFTPTSCASQDNRVLFRLQSLLNEVLNLFILDLSSISSCFQGTNYCHQTSMLK